MESITLLNYQSCLRPRRNLPSPPSHAGMPTTDMEEDDGPFFDLDLEASSKPTHSKFPSALGRRSRSTKLRVLILLGHRRQKPTVDASQKQQEQQISKPAEGEKRFGGEAVHKYMISKIKPLYVRVSKLRLSPGQIRSTKPSADVGFLVRNRLGKSAAVAPAAPRRDDLLMQQQDGIRSAIAHCKRYFNDAHDVGVQEIAEEEEEEEEEGGVGLKGEGGGQMRDGGARAARCDHGAHEE